MNVLSFTSCRPIIAGVFLLLAAFGALRPNNAWADIIDVDVTFVDPQYAGVFLAAEAFWEARIQSYSENLPPEILRQLTSLKITASTPEIDGEDGILGQGGPTGIVSHSAGESVAVVVTGVIEFDIADLPGLAADGILKKVIIHEMGHAMGFGTMWTSNDLIGPVNGVGLVEYINGRYAIQGYRRDINNSVAAYVPLEQRGGPGTALGHWFDGPPYFNQTFTGFKKELLTGFACDVDPDTGEIVCPPMFISEATWGAMADLGYEVAGANDNRVDPPRGLGTGIWYKTDSFPTTDGDGGGGNGGGDAAGGAGDGHVAAGGNGGRGIQGPFELNGVAPGPGIAFKRVEILGVTRTTPQGKSGQKPKIVKTNDESDPYGLRNQAWVK